jgi:ribosome-binding ATPase YchF (GTP1/OBG family)
MRFVDIAGLVRGASGGAGLGNAFLSHIRETDAIAMVVRCFDRPDVSHVEGDPDPLRDVEIINIEMALADLATLAKRVEKLGARGPRQREARPASRSRQAPARGSRGGDARPLVRARFDRTASSRARRSC